jgi:hypothetical protein
MGREALAWHGRAFGSCAESALAKDSRRVALATQERAAAPGVAEATLQLPSTRTNSAHEPAPHSLVRREPPYTVTHAPALAPAYSAPITRLR